MAKKPIRFDIGVVLTETNITSDGMQFNGQLGTDSTDNKLKVKLDGVIESVVTEAAAATLSNKSIDADNNSISNLEVDNLKSGVLNTSSSLSGASNTQVPSALAVKDYVDTSSGTIDTKVNNLVTLSGVAVNSTNLGTFTGSIIPDDQNNKQALQSLANNAATTGVIVNTIGNATNALIALSGVPSGSTDLGTFTGTTIPDGSTDKGALQALETSLESVAASNANKVTGPASATDNAVARYDLATGKLIQDSVVLISDTGDVSGVKDLAASGNATVAGNMTSSGVIASGDFREGVSSNNQSGTSVVLTGLTSPIVVLTNSGLVSIAGINAVASGRSITLINRTGNSVNIENEAVSVGTAAQRILTGTKSTLALADQASILIKDDSVNSRFSIIGGSGAGGGTSLSTILQLIGTDVTSWVSGNNTAFLGGGTLAGTLVANTTDPLQGISGYRYAQAAGSLNDYISSAVQPVDPRFRGNSATLVFPYNYNGLSTNIKVIVYCATSLQILSEGAFLQASTTNSIFRTNVTIPLACTGVRVGFQVAVVSSGSVFNFDSIELTSDTTVYADIADQTQSSMISQTANFANSVITGVLSQQTGSGNYTYNSATGTYTVTRTSKFFLGCSISSGSGIIVIADIRINGTSLSSGTNDNVAASPAYAGWNGILTANSTFQFWSASNNSVSQRISVLSTSSNQNILTAPDTFSTDTAPLVYAPAATYNLATLPNAPIGTFITFTYAINTNTRTQTSSSPSQTASDMNQNGINIFTRAYNQAGSSGALPCSIAIQIGKGLKGISLGLYKSAGKATVGTIEVALPSTTVQNGISIYGYNESTGVLIIDAGYCSLTTNTVHDILFSDISTQTSGYLTINASKNSALTGLNISAVAARAVQSSGQSIPSGVDTTMVYDSTKSFDTHGALNTATGVFTAPEAGYYQVNAGALFTSVSWTVGNTMQIAIIANGSVVKRSNMTATLASTYSLGAVVEDVVFLAKNGTVRIDIQQTRGTAAALISSVVWNNFSIAKVSVG